MRSSAPHPRIRSTGPEPSWPIRIPGCGEIDEPEPTPGHYCAKDEQQPGLTPVEDQHVARRPDTGASSPVVRSSPRPPAGTGCERSLIAGGSDHGQQPLGRDLPLGTRSVRPPGLRPRRRCARRQGPLRSRLPWLRARIASRQSESSRTFRPRTAHRALRPPPRRARSDAAAPESTR